MKQSYFFFKEIHKYCYIIILRYGPILLRERNFFYSASPDIAVYIGTHQWRFVADIVRIRVFIGIQVYARSFTIIYSR